MRSDPRLLILALLVFGCDPAPPTAAPEPVQSPQPTIASPATAVPTTGLETGAPGPSPTGFAFDPIDVIAYYQSIGYACEPPRPSSQAAGYTLTPCSLVDDDGRTRVIGLVTDGAGELGNGYAGVWAPEGATYLDPTDALDPLAAFLGTMLGAERGGEAAVWLKEHLGGAYATTTSGAISVATYTGTDDDPSELYVEVANQAYLEASPAPSSPPTP